MVRELWGKIEEKVTALGCTESVGFQPGSSDAEIDALEEFVGAKLPEGVRALLRCQNGQGPDATRPIVLGFRFMSLEDIRHWWTTWKDVYDEGVMNPECEEFIESFPEGVIKLMYCNPKWIPLSVRASNHIGIDLDPGENGKVGQVILFGRDDNRELLGDDIEDFLKRYYSCLESATMDGEFVMLGDFPHPAHE